MAEVLAGDLGEILHTLIDQQHAERDEGRTIEVGLRDAPGVERKGAVDLLGEIGARLLPLAIGEGAIDADHLIAVDRYRDRTRHLVDQPQFAGRLINALTVPFCTEKLRTIRSSGGTSTRLSSSHLPTLSAQRLRSGGRLQTPTLRRVPGKFLAWTFRAQCDVEPAAERQMAAGLDDEGWSLSGQFQAVGTEAMARDRAEAGKLGGPEADGNAAFVAARLAKPVISLAAGSDVLCRWRSAHRDERLRARHREPQDERSNDEHAHEERKSSSSVRPPLLLHRSWLSLLPRRLMVECTTRLIALRLAGDTGAHARQRLAPLLRDRLAAVVAFLGALARGVSARARRIASFTVSSIWS